MLVLGDLAHDGDEPSLRRALAPLRGGPAPLLAVGGNHDGTRPSAALAGWGSRRSSSPGGGRAARPPRCGSRARASFAAHAASGRSPGRPRSGPGARARSCSRRTSRAVARGRCSRRGAALRGRPDRPRAPVGSAARRPEPMIAVCGRMHVREARRRARCSSSPAARSSSRRSRQTSSRRHKAGVSRVTARRTSCRARTDGARPRLGPARERWTFTWGASGGDPAMTSSATRSAASAVISTWS